MKLKKIAKTIGNILGYVVMAALVAITAFVMISNARGEVPFLGKYSVMWVLTESMEPEIPARSNILIEKADPSTLEVGDIIVFISDDPSITTSATAVNAVKDTKNTVFVIFISRRGTERLRARRWVFKTVYNPDVPIDKFLHPKVYQQAKLKIHDYEVSLDLFQIERVHLLSGF